MRRRRSRRSAFGADIWPGFVDALASLLMVVIFLLMVFALAQHYLSTALSGRDIALAEAAAAATAAATAQTAAETRIAAQDMALRAAAATLDKAKVGAQEDAAQIANLEDALARAVRKTTTTKSALDRALADKAEVQADRDKAQADRVKAQADSAKAQAAQLAAAASAAKTAAAALAVAEARIADQGAVLRRTAKNLGQVEVDLAQTENDRDRIAANLSQTEASLQAAAARALAEAARADTAETNAARLNADLAAGRDVAAALQQAIKQAEGRAREQAREQAAALAALQAEIQAKGAALTTAGTATATLETRLNALEQQISALNGDLAAGKAASKKALGAAAAEASAKAVDYAREINRLNAELDAALALAARAVEDLRDVRGVLADAEDARDVAASRAAARKAELLALRQSADADLAASAQSIQAAKAAAAAFTREIAALEVSLAGALHRFGESEGRRKALEEEARRLRHALASAQQSDAGAIAAREALAARLAERDSANTRAVARYQGRIGTLEADISRLNARAIALQGAADAAETGLIQARTAAAGVTEERDRVIDEKVRIARLNAELQAKLDQLNTALDAALTDAEARGATIVQLRGKLNAALAAKVSELRRYRSEFFGRLSALIGDRKDIRVVGDRFVLQSEVLFATAKAELGPRGKASMGAIARSLKQIIDTIPGDVNWVLRVDGHTDQRAIANERFPSNWELSTARAVAVVRALAAAGIPQNRMIAAGFGEHYPFEGSPNGGTANGADAAEVNRRNRRIEFKLTTR